ncbi:MAG: hypothetical protein MUO82_07290 [Candidatus Thermoplasmatota archaeon]|nr:hypothetical protein [Candidatus Thermoplasmatota archaeon]
MNNQKDMKNKIKKSPYKIKLDTLLPLITFDYNRLSKNVENIDSRVNGLFMAASALIAIITFVNSYFQKSYITMLFFFASIFFSLMCIIASIMVLYPRPFIHVDKGEQRDIEKTKNLETDLNYLKKIYSGKKHQIIEELLLNVISQVKILNQKIKYYRFSIIFFILAVVCISIGFISIMGGFNENFHNNPILINEFKVDQAIINIGETANLSWNISGASSVMIDNNIGNVSLIGTRIISPDVTTIYTLTAFNSTASCNVTTKIIVRKP